MLVRLFLVLLPVYAVFGSTTDFWITQSGAGSANGSTLSNAASCGGSGQTTCTAFNNASNWGAGSAQIGPGTTIHLSGTITAAAQATDYMAFQGSGSSGSPITLKFESGAVLTAPSWGNGPAVAITGVSYVTIDGGGSGLIQTTANGTGLTYQDNSTGVAGIGCSNCVVKNMLIGPIYVHACTPPSSSCTDENGQNSGAIYILDGDNVVFQNNIVHDAKWCIGYAWDANHSSLAINRNTAYNCDHGIAVEGGSAFTLTGATANANTFHDFQNWDDAAVNNHHDGIHFWAVVSGAVIVNPVISNNYFYGNWGSGLNAFIYDEVEGGTQDNAQIFNNLGVDGTPSSIGGSGCGYVCAMGLSALVANNTMASLSNSIGTAYHTYGKSVTFYNNVAYNVFHALNVSGTLANWNYNSYYNIGSGGFGGGGSYAAWRAACSCDGNSLTSNPNLNSSYRPSAGSPLILAGINLSGLAIAPLDFDAAATPRPSSGNWDIGAGGPVPPTTLTAAVR